MDSLPPLPGALPDLPAQLLPADLQADVAAALPVVAGAVAAVGRLRPRTGGGGGAPGARGPDRGRRQVCKGAERVGWGGNTVCAINKCSTCLFVCLLLLFFFSSKGRQNNNIFSVDRCGDEIPCAP